MKLSLFKDLVEAIFIERSNRFVVECRIGGRRARAYLPNPGRLWELLLPEVTLLLEPARKREGLPYTVVAVKRDGLPVMLHTHRTNQLAAFLVNRGAIKGLEGFRVVKEEVAHGDSRFDLLLENERGEKLLTEVKSVTLYSGRLAMFPDAPTVRGVKHLNTLGELGGGVRGAVLFVVFSREAEYFLPEFHIDPQFAHTLMKIKDRVEIIPIGVELTERLELKPPVRRLTIPWHIVEKEAGDSGAYMLILRANKPQRVAIGEKTVELEEGYYTYVGSARKGLTKRIARHMRKRKRLFWHIDHIRAVTEPLKAIPIRTRDSIECELAESLGTLFSPLKGLGCSDCRCPAHLFYSSQDPLKMPEFIALILHYRMDRLVETGL